MNTIEQYNAVCARIKSAAITVKRDPKDIRLVAVSKEASLQQISELVAAGHLDFGENRTAVGSTKAAAIGGDLRWHMLGRIQTNKIKELTPFCLIHSLDRWGLADKMNRFALDQQMVFQCLIQVNVSRDPDKAGFLPEDLDSVIEKIGHLDGLKIQGLMTILALDSNEEQTLAWYKELAHIYANLSKGELPPNIAMRWLSMGMSADFELAVTAGANLIRIGSAIFAEKEAE